MSPTRKRILIVEDEALVAEALRVRLEQLGYGVVGVTATGEEAVEMVVTTHPDLVLMDIRLAGQLDGVAAGEQIQARFGLPVVYLTANTDRETLNRVLSSRPAGYVSKPINDAALQSAISIALQKDALERAYRRRERYYTSTLDKLEEAVLVLDADQRVVFFNPAAAALIGHTPGDTVTPHLADCLAFTDDAGEVIDPITRCLTWGEETSIERVWCQSAAGERALVSVEVIPLPAPRTEKGSDTLRDTELVVLLRRVPTVSSQASLPAYIRVCAYCRDIMERNAEGLTVTMRFETYFQRCCGYQFTHGICPNCREALRRR
ncbi:MAG: response regulator [Chloracidobacterium sp.]|nr:response regulator [Chloracidobacterium sp.]MDW8218172.1 response regulator [Acidobacteriota bacterium]